MARQTRRLDDADHTGSDEDVDRGVGLPEDTAPDGPAVAPPSAARPARPRRPSFGISQGVAEDLRQYGRAGDPFTGELLEDEDRLAELDRQAKARGETRPRRQAG